MEWWAYFKYEDRLHNLTLFNASLMRDLYYLVERDRWVHGINKVSVSPEIQQDEVVGTS